MYRHLYGLTHKPFQISTDPAFLWLGGKHREALAVLVYGVRDGRGFLLLSGGVGTGKTTLIRSLLNQLDRSVAVATVQDPGLKPLEFFNLIATAYGMRRPYTNKVDFLFDFEKFLRKTRNAGRTALLIVDEAQRLDQTLLEEIRLLSNIEDPDRKLLNVFFVGQEEFLDTLSAPENRALKQRITINYHLPALNAEETEQLVRHRLKVAGATREVFTKEAFPLIHRFSQGAPRLINILCDHALLTGFVKDVSIISAEIIDECIEDLMLPGEHSRYLPSPPPGSPPGTAVPPRPVAAAVTAGMLLQDRPPPTRRLAWPWAAAAGLLLAVGLGVSLQRGWLPLSDPQIVARVTPVAVEKPSPPAQEPAAATTSASVPSDADGQALEASAPPEVLPDSHPANEALPDRSGFPAERQTPPNARPSQEADGDTPAAEATAAATARLEDETFPGHQLPAPLPPDPATAANVQGKVAPAAPPAPIGGAATPSPPSGQTMVAATDSETNAGPVEAVAAGSAEAQGAPPAIIGPPQAAAAQTGLGPPGTPVLETAAAATPPPQTPRLAALEGPSPIGPAALPEAAAAPHPPAETPAPFAVPADPTQDRLRDFISAYCRAYESLDLNRFRLFFAEDAQEGGRPFGTVLPLYQRNFATLDELEYTIDLRSWEEDNLSGRITLNGSFDVRYRIQSQDWRTTKGEITMDLVPAGKDYRVKRLDYRKD